MPLGVNRKTCETLSYRAPCIILGSGEHMMPSIDAIEYGYVRTIDLPFEEAVKRTEAALKAEGFGVLC